MVNSGERVTCSRSGAPALERHVRRLRPPVDSQGWSLVISVFQGWSLRTSGLSNSTQCDGLRRPSCGGQVLQTSDKVIRQLYRFIDVQCAVHDVG